MLRQSDLPSPRILRQAPEAEYVIPKRASSKRLEGQELTLCAIAVKQPPFTIKEKGWGEFDMQIVLSPVGNPKGGDQTLHHDLNFQQERYESTHTVVCQQCGRCV